jgi:hypothetical protein
VEFEQVLYQGNDAKGMQEIFEDFSNLRISNFMKGLRNQKIEKETCQEILDGKFNCVNLDKDDIRFVAAEFHRKVNEFQKKYIKKIVEKEKKKSTPRTPKQATPQTLKQATPGQPKPKSAKRATLKETPSKSGPKVVASKVSVHSTPRSTLSSSRITKSQKPMTKKAKKPAINLVKPYTVNDENSEHIIARDILHVALQFVDTDDEDWPFNRNYFINIVLEVAKKYKKKEVSGVLALKTISHIFFRLPCIPSDFHKYFIYHTQNEYFDDCIVEQQAENAAARSEVLISKLKFNCTEDESLKYAEESKAMSGIYDLMNMMEDSVDKLIDFVKSKDKVVSVEEIFAEREKFIKQHGAYLKKMGIFVGESEKERDVLITFPSGCKGYLEHDIAIGRDRLVGGLPSLNTANVIQEGMTDLEAKLARQRADLIGELNRFRYVLKPRALERQTFWQARGNAHPAWFPGIQTVFPNSFNYSVQKMTSPEAAFLNAWRMMVPQVQIKS